MRTPVLRTSSRHKTRLYCSRLEILDLETIYRYYPIYVEKNKGADQPACRAADLCFCFSHICKKVVGTFLQISYNYGHFMYPNMFYGT